MGLISRRDKRDKLRLFYAAALDVPKVADDDGAEASKLFAVLMGALKACDESINSGRMVSSTSGAGRTTAFQLLTEFSPVQARRLVGELLDLYEVVKVDGVTDAVVYAAMMDKLRKRVATLRQDYTGLRYGSGVSVVTN